MKKRWLKRENDVSSLFPDSWKDLQKRCFARDNYKCQFPNCNSKRKLQMHHIIKKSDAPLLTFDINNVITICWEHHKLITGDEDRYQQIFFGILGDKTNADNKKKDNSN